MKEIINSIPFIISITEKIGGKLMLIPALDFSLRSVESCANLLTPNIIKSRKRFVLDNITPTLKNLTILGSIFRHASRMYYGNEGVEIVGGATILFKEFLCLYYISEQYANTSINIRVDPSDRVMSGIQQTMQEVESLRAAITSNELAKKEQGQKNVSLDLKETQDCVNVERLGAAPAQ